MIKTRLKKHIVIIDCTPKGQASKQMGDDETTKQKKSIHGTATASKYAVTPLQQQAPPKFQFTNYFF